MSLPRTSLEMCVLALWGHQISIQFSCHTNSIASRMELGTCLANRPNLALRDAHLISSCNPGLTQCTMSPDAFWVRYQIQAAWWDVDAKPKPILHRIMSAEHVLFAHTGLPWTCMDTQFSVQFQKWPHLLKRVLSAFTTSTFQIYIGFIIHEIWIFV